MSIYLPTGSRELMTSVRCLSVLGGQPLVALVVARVKSGKLNLSAGALQG